MAYDEALADRIRDELTDEPDLVERKMFGGLAFLLGGHMTVVASGEGGMMARVGVEIADDLIESTAAEQVVMKDRPMSGWLRVPTEALDDDELKVWIDRSVSFTSQLPPKT